MYIITMLILAILVILLISMAKVYRSIPIIELKRRARAGQEPAKSIYRVASYEYSSQFVLYFLAIIISAIFFVMIADKAPIWVAITGDIALIWLAYVWIPMSSISIVSQYSAQVIAKPYGWFLQYIHPFLIKFKRRKAKSPHTGLYEKSDIVRLLEAQQKQEDNRIEKLELELLKNIVDFSSIQVTDIMTPKTKVQSVPDEEILGPIVLSELHKSGHSYFPVIESDTDNIVGVLSIAGINSTKNSQRAGEVMSHSVFYVHEEQSLAEVLQVMIKSSQELFVVVNSLDEYVGIITSREVLKCLVGNKITQKFDQYDQRDIVAKRFSVTEEAKEENAKEEQKEHEDETEVIE